MGEVYAQCKHYVIIISSYDSVTLTGGLWDCAFSDSLWGA